MAQPTQWWYSDVVSSDSNLAVVAQFYPGWFPNASAVLLNLVLPDGTVSDQKIPVGNLVLTAGTSAFLNTLAHWYWGHATVGCYSRVFFYHLDLSQKVTTSVYLAHNGEVVVSGCSTVGVIPQGRPGLVILVGADDDVDSWAIKINDPVHGKFAFTVENVVKTTMPRPYIRWVGRAIGGRVRGVNSTGSAITELMRNPFISV
ncbi:hypothetical protein BJX99DRAFT_253238 [Aspergillus californicus]